MKPRALVLFGDGINCDLETQQGLELAGFAADRIHTSQFLANPSGLFDAQLLALPGGFSFGDEIASGKVLAIKLRHKLRETLYQFIDQGKLVLGICNGFQVLTQLGFLPFSNNGAPRVVTLDHNSGGKFINRWTSLQVDKDGKSPFFQSLDTIELPIRHGEGRLRLAPDAAEDTHEQVKNHCALRYAEDVNGSYDRIAALTNTKGTVLGLMPHPEAFVRFNQHPDWNRKKASANSAEPAGLVILKNAFAAVN
jgi:phosphoribosylformylglycinamidine synthase subunit PurQ / glutaminase